MVTKSQYRFDTEAHAIELSKELLDIRTKLQEITGKKTLEQCFEVISRKVEHYDEISRDDVIYRLKQEKYRLQEQIEHVRDFLRTGRWE